MNQIRYVLDACLILMMALMGIFLYTTFPESNIVGKTVNEDIFSPVSNTEAPTSKGQMVFKQNCASCHNMEKDMISAPALKGVEARGQWGDKEKLRSWIKNPESFLSDSHVQELKRKYGALMPSQSHLSDAEIDEVILYITSQ